MSKSRRYLLTIAFVLALAILGTTAAVMCRAFMASRVSTAAVTYVPCSMGKNIVVINGAVSVVCSNHTFVIAERRSIYAAYEYWYTSHSWMGQFTWLECKLTPYGEVIGCRVVRKA